jgi:IclR family acetate operon transcriptional repressor
MSDAGPETPGRTRALDRGLMILETLATRPQMTLAEIAEACELSPATALRILRTLEMRNFVHRDDESRAFGIGLKAFEVGSRFLSETRLTETCRLILRRLAGATGQSATLAILDRSDIVYVDVHEGSAPLRSTPEMGQRAPAHATAAGKCLLADRWVGKLTEAIGEGPYAAMTPRTITAREALREELATVRRDGLAIEHGELLTDISGAACPVRDRTGEVVAAIALQAPSALMEAQGEDWIGKLRAAAAETSHRLGWRDHRAPPSSTISATPLVD